MSEDFYEKARNILRKLLLAAVLVLAIVVCVRGFISVPKLEPKFVKAAHYTAEGHGEVIDLQGVEMEDFLECMDYSNITCWRDDFTDMPKEYYYVVFNDNQFLKMYIEPFTYHGKSGPLVQIQTGVGFAYFEKYGTVDAQKFEKAMSILKKYI